MVDRTAAGLILAVVALLAPAPALALAAEPDRRIWDAYPLPAADDDATGRVASQAPASEMVAAPSDGVERLAVASVLALIAGGLTTWLVSLRWPHSRLATVRVPAARPRAAPVRTPTPEPWVHDVAPPAVEPAVEPSAVAPRASPAPPDPDRAWAAEVGWHLVAGAAQFRVAARPVDGGAEPVMLAASPALQWPPEGAHSVGALADAVRTLESALVSAGWTPRPRGGAWFAKRFAWQPGATRNTVPPARTRHRELYETEFARQVDRAERLRRTIGARLVDGQVAGSARE
jgi:hypothetical protein